MADGWSVSLSVRPFGSNFVCKGTARSPDGASTSDLEFTIYATAIPCREQCAAPFVEVNGKCSCPAGTQETLDKYGVKQCTLSDDKLCEAFYAINTVSGGSLVQDYRLQGNITNGAQFCMPGAFDDQTRGCKVNFSRDAFMDYGSGNAITEGSFDAPASSAGSACTAGDADAPKVPNEEKCPSGYTGTVNGVEVCVNKVPDSGVGGGTDETTTDDGTNTTTTRTETSTNCKDGKCVTTTTITTTVTNNAAGTSTTTTNTGTTTESQSNFCKANPSNKLCGGSGGGSGTGDGEKDPSSFAGACQAGFQCKGDAIQCAIAREQHIRSCKLFDDKTPESELYQQHKGKEGDQTKELPGNETVSIADKINSSDALNAGSAGLSDLNITVWKTPVTLPLSMLNKYLAAMGNVLLAVSFLLAFRIVARG